MKLTLLPIMGLVAMSLSACLPDSFYDGTLTSSLPDSTYYSPAPTYRPAYTPNYGVRYDPQQNAMVSGIGPSSPVGVNSVQPRPRHENTGSRQVELYNERVLRRMCYQDAGDVTPARALCAATDFSN